MRQVLIVMSLACACALCMTLVASADNGSEASTPTATQTETAATLSHAHIQKTIDRYRHRAWHWQRVMGRPIRLTLANPPANPLVRIHVWKRLSSRLRAVAMHPPHLNAWLCIHRYEGAWSDEGAPYYGGLQMDLGFQRTYGARLFARKGTADHWTPLEQMWVAERALHAGRGFWPWPNTARYCGLI